MRARVLTALFAASLAVALAPGHAAAANDCNPTGLLRDGKHITGLDPVYAGRLLSYINARRQERGVAPLQAYRSLWLAETWMDAFAAEHGADAPMTVPCDTSAIAWGDQIVGGFGFAVPATIYNVIVEDGQRRLGSNPLLDPSYKSIGIGVVMGPHSVIGISLSREEAVPFNAASLIVRLSEVSLRYNGTSPHLEKVAAAASSDPDGYTQVIAAKAAHGGAFTDGQGVFSYTPASGFIGDDTITYTVANIFG